MWAERPGRRIVFDEAFDGAAWPGPLADREAAFGDAWLGPRELLALLETDLGLSGAFATDAERAAALLPSLRRLDGVFRASFEVDELGTARRLLSDRDALWMAGWRGQPLSRRLEELARATDVVPPGIPDRLQAVADALRARSAAHSIDVESLQLLEPIDTLPDAWRRVLEGLQARGVKVGISPLEPTPGAGDLAAARAEAFAPKADGSLQLLRPYGPRAAAEDVAAYLAAQDDLGGYVIIGADAGLDRALERHGLPATGASPPDDALIGLLPLVVELGWSPPDPAVALELLSLPQGPIPTRIARSLCRALYDTPAVDSEVWRKRLREELDAIAEDDRRRRVSQRIEVLFSEVARRDERYPIRELKRRAELLSQWASAARAAAYDDGTSYVRVETHCRIFTSLLEASELDSLSPAELSRWLEIATESMPPAPGSRAGAGLGAVARPDAVAGPAPCVIWCHFERGKAPQPERQGLTRAEWRALLESGARPLDRQTRALTLARRWRRPLSQALSRLVFVCAERGEDGGALSPHPLWDEIRASASSGGGAVEALVRTWPDLGNSPERIFAAPVPLPRPKRAFRTRADSIPPRDPESPSGLASLLGCSLKWALHYHGKLRAGSSEPLESPGPLYSGNVAHKVLETVAADKPASAENAAERAIAIFDAYLPRGATALALPGHEAERDDLRLRIARAARSLFQLVNERGHELRGAEEVYRRGAVGTALEGRPDLVLTDPELVIDIKYGSASRHSRALREGTALQLAAYSYVAASASPPPHVAYFVVRSQELIENSDSSPDLMWAAAEAAWKERAAEIARGELFAPAVAEDGDPVREEDAVEDGVLRLSPPCRFCDYDALCGAGLGGRA